MCCLVRCQIPATSYSMGITTATEKFLDLVLDLNNFSFSNPNPNPTHLRKHQTLSLNHQFFFSVVDVG